MNEFFRVMLYSVTSLFALIVIFSLILPQFIGYVIPELKNQVTNTGNIDAATQTTILSAYNNIISYWYLLFPALFVVIILVVVITIFFKEKEEGVERKW